MACIEWKPVPIEPYNQWYEVSNNRQVRSRKTNHCRLLKKKHNRFTGYDYVQLHGCEKPKTITVHRLVALAFLPNPDKKPEINHINENKCDNCIENLEWVTAHENNEHSKYKRQKPIIVKDADGRLLARFESAAIMARMLNISKSSICTAAKNEPHICNGLIVNYCGGDEL